MFDREERKTYLAGFCARYEYGKKAEADLLTAFDAVLGNADARDTLTTFVEDYENGGRFNDKNQLDALKDTASAVNVDPYTLHLLYTVLCTEEMRRRYEKAGVPDGIIEDSMHDFKWKKQECDAMFGVTGTFVAWWFDRWFDATRYAIGRLQFELIYLDRDVTTGGFFYKKGDFAVNVHIPSCGPLDYGACEDAYRRAETFFRERRLLDPDKPVLFVCHSWLLYPDMIALLGPTSRIRRFAADYTVLESKADAPGVFPWSLFNKPKTVPLADLPDDTSLRRTVKNALLSGTPVTGSALGVMIRSK